VIVILQPNLDKQSNQYQRIMQYLTALPNIQVRIHDETGIQQVLTEVYLIGDTAALSAEDIQSLPGVERVVRV
jgi:3-deoxy-7-phosphoheptulonate synthase